IISPTADLNIGTDGAYGSLTSGGAPTLNAMLGDLTINSNVTSQGAMQLIANGDVTFAAGTSAAPLAVVSSNGAVTPSGAPLTMGAYSDIDPAGVITIATTGDATLGQLNSSLSYADAHNAPSIVVSAGGVTDGSIISNGDGRTNIVVTGNGAEVALNGSNIG